ncbi:DUF5689 domain-containing protein [Dysgonomonas macrotermitis]|uniref:DUF5689 domain-containing protein n=1 Tax=Dysgonomonas macrotermitis TaxID=1346286 RepID=A0A1M4W9W1_9BACT|nr:DUF5689 domain-containing protein [Dysgonomonas macrotermitis]SHE77999.1 hypothetical protein SAMN05444362_102170 [Dysgonomonas macrotermitis]
MDTLKKIFYLILTVLSITSCTRDYDAPLIPEPSYDGKVNLTIAELKKKYANTVSGTPTLIDVDYVIKGYVTANDKSGNIFKQLYIQDGSAAINIGIDQNSIYTSLNVGQEVFINLHGFSIVNYGGELQIGYDGTNANRIAWDIFDAQTFLNGWPDESKATPKTVNMNSLTPDMVNMLVRLDNVYFVNGGKNNFAANDATTNEAIKNGNGNTLDVRTSSYANFAANLLPSGSGSIIGILGRFNSSWQLLVRSTDDLINFGGELPGTLDPETPAAEVVFNETFGDGYYPSGNRPKIADFTDFDMKSPVVYTDATGNADVRSISGDNGVHVWFPANNNSQLKISGINTSGKSNLVLSYQVAANLYDAGSSGNLNAITVKCNGTSLSVPSTPVSNANGDNSKFYTFRFENIVATENLTLEFATTAEANAIGLRLDNIKIEVKSDNIVLEASNK